LIISKTPFRISFFGGGTDYSVWTRENGGAVLGTTIDKYAYINCRYLPPFFEHKYRIVYSKMENVNRINEINHPAVRECIRYTGINSGLEIHHDSDLPARSGLGSSSTFTVGLLNCLNALKGRYSTKQSLAEDAIKVEQDLIGENVGCQDQIHAAFGGLNYFKFYKDGTFIVNPVVAKQKTILDLQDHCLLFFTGISRFASEVALEQIKKTPDKQHELHTMQEMVGEGLRILDGERVDLDEFGKLLNESWKLKRSLTAKISNDLINDMYAVALAAGATGGKLLGAGGGGFILFIAKPEFHDKIRHALHELLHVPFNFDNTGSTIIFYQP